MDRADPLLWAWADARPGCGLGHVVRTIGLAQAWNDAHGRSCLVTAATSGAIRATVRAAGIDHLVRPDLDLIGAGAEAALVFGARAAEQGAAWVSLDGYGLSIDVQREIRQRARLLVLDDYAMSTSFDADLVLDQNLGADDLPVHRSGAARVLAGSRYCLLRRQFRSCVSPTSDQLRSRVVILLGGGPESATVDFAAAVANALAGEIDVDVMLGASGTRAAAGTARVHPFVTDPLVLMDNATVAVSTAGSSSWELCRRAVPSVLLAVADNQRLVGARLHAVGAARFVGDLAETDPAEVAGEVRRLLADPDLRRQMGSMGQGIVDGHGASRVVTHMRASLMRLRRATNRDTLRLFKWANDPHVRRRSFSADPIAWDDHVRWFEERVTSDRCWMYVAEDESGEPMGQIRFDLIEPTSSRSASASPEVEVGVSIAAEHRGLGLAAPLIAAGVRAAAVDGCRYPTRATVRADNLPSQRAFVAADFDKTSTRSFRTDVVHDYRYAEPR